MRTALIASGFAAGLALAQGASAQDETESWLFLEQADAVEFEDGRLTLEGVDDTIIMFSERPFHDVEDVPLGLLIDNWKDGIDSFAALPPNAALTGLRDGEQVALIVELSNPEHSGDTVSFAYDLIDGDDSGDLVQVALLIDGIAIAALMDE